VKTIEGKGTEGRGGEGTGREGTSQYFIAPQFQFSRNIPVKGYGNMSNMAGGVVEKIFDSFPVA